ncbi:hypothetical protein [Silvibacterium dinghuense]|uniref:hypothetical protein n=1 Tax=Silvibacterium dinghuense TaxID=1560006 RepID=UPI0013E90E3E|nr:hypothetical protein [Silvibacterium dinghuense]GGG98805.1 hypothetical protein GCM10011586_12840 [Silvibacterium dinghuense]
MQLHIAEPGLEDVIVENRAVALNPVDWKVLPSTALGWQSGLQAGRQQGKLVAKL